MKMDATLKFIGHIETPYSEVEHCPRNINLDGPRCCIVIKKEFADAMLGLESGMNILILYWFETVNREKLQQNSRKTGDFRGTFAIRSPNRPNPIGVAVLQIKEIQNNMVFVNGLDCLNGTPLLDIKPAMLLET